MSNDIQTEKLDDGIEVVTTTSIAGKTTETKDTTATLPPAPTTPPTLEQTIASVAPSLISSLIESAKKIGMPATVAAIVSVLVTVTPFLFKIDERYAKASELQESIDQNKEDLAKLTAEVGRVAGAVDVLSQIVGQQYKAIQEIDEAQARASAALARPTITPETPARAVRSAAPPRPIVAAAPAPVVALSPAPSAAEFEAEETEDLQYDSSQDINASLNNIRRNLEESRKTLSTIQEREE